MTAAAAMLLDLHRLWQRFLRRGFASQVPKPPFSMQSPEPIFRLPDTHKAAAARLIDPAAIRSPVYLKRKHTARLEQLRPEMQLFVTRFLKEMEARKMPFIFFSGFRGEAEQNALFKLGTSKAKFGQSAHNFGAACDMVHAFRYWDLSRKEWDVVGLIGKEVARKLNLKVTWGGDWRDPYDPAHWQLANWRDLK